ncbi:MAG: peptidase M61, partial [Xanthomonadales bacterium]|nr:peptidase M61 [Xanthomonadales bacterium]
MTRHMLTRLMMAATLLLFAGTAFAQVQRSHQVPPPLDVPYPGTIIIHVDASDTAQGIFRVHETIPVQTGKFTLLYPQWIPGGHSPGGPVAMLAGLKISAAGQRLDWTRDKYNVYAFHLDVPEGVTSLDVDFQYLSSRRNGSDEMTGRMLMLEWNNVSLYPAGHYSRDITFVPSVTLPHGWQFGTALEKTGQSQNSATGDTTTFKPVTFNTLVD